jgi:hypothetical protein
MSSLYTIFVQYTTEQTESALRHLNKLERILTPLGASERIMIDNYLPNETSIILDSQVIYGGDNTYMEFSGWQIGLEKLVSKVKINDKDVILIANDSFHRNYKPDWIEGFNGKHFHLASKKKYLIGWTDQFIDPINIMGKERKGWIRSNCFIINYGLLRQILPFFIEQKPDSIFTKKNNSFFKENSPLPFTYREYLKVWLFGEKSSHINFYNQWYKSEPLNENNYDFFIRKAYSIICEHSFSFRAVDAGGKLLSINPKKRLSLIKRIKIKSKSYFS